MDQEKSKADTTDAHPTHDWLESAKRDYAWSNYEFFGQEWGEKLIAEVERLRESALTEDEADHALTGWLSHGRSRHCVCVECERLREKLTALANLSGSPREGRSDV